MKKKPTVLIFGLLLCLLSTSCGMNPLLPEINSGENLYFKGGIPALQEEINHSLETFNDKSEVVDIQPILETDSYMLCLYLTDTNRFGDIYYQKNEDWCKFVTLSEGKPVSSELPEVGKWYIYSDDPDQIAFGPEFDSVIDRASISSSSVILKNPNGEELEIYINIADTLDTP